MSLSLLLLLAALQTTVVKLPSQQAARRPTLDRPNIVLILGDDMGVDMVGAYAEGASPPCTPNIDDLALQGMLFRNAWANPTCSPTRAATLTGRYGFRNGIGTPAMAGLSLAETIIPDVLSEHSSAALGKWHLGAGLGSTHPNDMGFEHYAGGLNGALPSYTAWDKTVDGSTSPTTTYATTDTADEAIFAAQTLPEPWFLYVNFNAPHTPTHVPDSALCPEGPCAVNFCDSSPMGSPALVKAMVEALDTEIGRMLTAIEAVDPNAYIVFMGDNGTGRQATEAPFDPDHAKGSLYEGGVNVPLIVKGPGVVHAESAALVSAVDLLATFAELTGRTTTADDSVSFVPCLANPRAAPRDTVYAESFSPNNSTLPFASHTRAVRNTRYKLIRDETDPDELYDLFADEFEINDLFPTLVPGSEQHDNYLELVQVLIDLGVD